MIIESQATKLTQEAFRRAVLQSNTRRKDDAAKKLDYYNDDQGSHILAQIHQFYKKPEKIAPVSINIVKKIIRLLSTVYLQDATRLVDGTKQDQDIYAGIEDAASLPTRMKTANRYSKLLGTILLRPVWRNGRMDMDILTPDILDVVCGDSPEDMRAVMVTQYSNSGKTNEIEYSLWTPEAIQRLDYRFAVIAEEANPYAPVLPFVPVFSSTPTSEFWLSGASDLILAQDSINERLVDIWHTMRFQSFGVLYITGTKPVPGRQGASVADIDVGPGSAIYLPEDGKIGFAAPNAPVADSLAAIEFLIKQAAVCNGLSASSVTTDPVEESGISKIVGNSELMELRADDIALFARVEQQLFEVIRVVWNYHNPGRQISAEASLATDFFDPQPVTSPLEQIKEQVALMEAGLASPVDILIQRNPDLSRSDAKAKLLEIKEELAEFGQNLLV